MTKRREDDEVLILKRQEEEEEGEEYEKYKYHLVAIYCLNKHTECVK